MSTKRNLIKAPADFVNPHANSNLQEVPRILRIVGQVEGIKKMIESKRHCYEVIHQVRAVRAALRSLEANILENHIEHVLTEILNTKRPADRNEKKKDLLNVLKGKYVISGNN